MVAVLLLVGLARPDCNAEPGSDSSIHWDPSQKSTWPASESDPERQVPTRFRPRRRAAAVVWSPRVRRRPGRDGSRQIEMGDVTERFFIDSAVSAFILHWVIQAISTITLDGTHETDSTQVDTGSGSKLLFQKCMKCTK